MEKKIKTYKSKNLRKQLGAFIKVRPIYSNRSGEPVRNQYDLIFENGSIFQSYDSLISIYVKGKYYFSDKHDCSTTTSKYCNEWCGRNGKERRAGIESGEFGRLDTSDMGY